MVGLGRRRREGVRQWGERKKYRKPAASLLSGRRLAWSALAQASPLRHVALWMMPVMSSTASASDGWHNRRASRQPRLLEAKRPSSATSAMEPLGGAGRTSNAVERVLVSGS